MKRLRQFAATFLTISIVSLTSEAISSDYQRCFNEEQARALIAELVEKDSLELELELLNEQISLYKLRELEHLEVEFLLTQQRDDLLALVERTDAILAESEERRSKSFCSTKMCKFVLTSGVVVLTGFTSYLIIREVR